MSEQQQRAPDIIGNDWRTWGRRLVTYIAQTRSTLVQQNGDENASDDGTIMWDRVYKYPVVSEGGEWRQIVLEGGHANFIKTSDVTPALASTAYKLTYDAPTGNTKITQGTPAKLELYLKRLGNMYYHFPRKYHQQAQAQYTFTFGLA